MNASFVQNGKTAVLSVYDDGLGIVGRREDGKSVDRERNGEIEELEGNGRRGGGERGKRQGWIRGLRTACRV